MDQKTTVVKTGGGNIGLILLAIALAAIAVIGFFIYENEQRNDPINQAASAVGDAAQDVGDAAKGK